jgi:DNA-binding MarR family transcriptional regulator
MVVESDLHLLQAIELTSQRLGLAMRRRMTARVGKPFRGSHGRLLHVIDAQGSRPSALAEKTLITRQAVGQRLKEMEAEGWVESLPDPDDARALIVRRTAAGEKLRKTSLSALKEVEAEVIAELGVAEYRRFKQVLDRLAGGA